MHSQSIGHRLVAALVVLAGLAGISLTAQAATYYVRTDGGTAAQCNGTANAPTSAAPNCAWSSPVVALPMGDDGYGQTMPTALIKGGDTLVIASGSYMVGYSDTPIAGTQGQSCNKSSTYECAISNIPSGLDAAHPTVIQGDCSAPPELWGTQRINGIFQLYNGHDIKLSCLNLTDHSICIYAYGPTSATGGVTSCNYSSYPYGTYAMYGLQAVNMTNLTLDNLNIHGFAQYGILAGLLHGNTLLNNLTLRANGWGGWNNDISGKGYSSSSNDGNLTFNNLVVAWNGCSEAWPATTIVGCWGQANGGYGDGIGTAATGGNWTFNNATIYQNAQDGLDLLYHSLGGRITINGGTFYSNIGNQIKVKGNATIQNTVVNGYCNNFAQYPVGGAGGNPNDNCRAAGTAVVMAQNGPNQTSEIKYSTINGDGDTLLIGTGSESDNYVPNTSNVWTYENNILLGQASAWRTGTQTALDWYSDGTFNGIVKYVSNIVWNVKNGVCPASSICKDPQLVNETLAGFYQNLLSSSPAIDNANSAYTVPVDYYGNPRPVGAGYDIGAVEYQGSSSSQAGTPSANFTFSASGLTVNFTDASTDAGGTIGSWSWSFGDGASSSAQSPSHTYAAAGTYQVSQTVTDKASGKTSVRTAQVTVTASQPVGGTPAANFTYTTAGLTASFIDTSTDAGGTIGSWSWSFGDGTSSSVQSPSHTYAAAGSYQVSVTVTDKANGKTSVRTAQVTVTAPQPTGGSPAANFTFSASGLTVNFTDASTDTGGTIGSWSWSFGDGTSSSVQSPSHTYAAAGSYQVSVTVTDKVNGKTSVRTAQVTVTAPQPVGGTPAANFTYTTAGLTASFIDTSTDAGGTIGSWSWSFGDGTSSSVQSPSHTYAAAGAYRVSVTVTDKVNGKTSTRTTQVTVTAPQQQLTGGTPRADFTQRVSGLVATFTDTSTDAGGTISSWSWTFGDGTTSSGRHPRHAYREAGNYMVTQTVRDQASGRTSTTSNVVSIVKVSRVCFLGVCF